MPSDVGVGDAELPYLDVAPADAGTEATLVAWSPAGGSSQVVVSAGPLEPIPGTNPTEYTQRWTADTPLVYDQPGRWVLAWTVTGTGEGAETLELFVAPSPVAGGPAWWPTRSRVANYVTHRTLARNPAAVVASQEAHQLTFDSTTVPTGVQVDRLIADGAAWVGMRVTPMADAMQPAAAVVVSLYAAAAVERQFPADEQSLQRANDIDKTMQVLLGELADANSAVSGTGAYGAVTAAPYWQFPPADTRYDSRTYW